MYFKQIAVGNMGNFAYIFGSEENGTAAVVDPAFDVDGLLQVSQTDGYKIKFIFSTHGHLDHVGGHVAMIAKTGAKVIAHRREVEMIRKNGVPVDLPVDDGDEIRVGELTVRIIHTPGHTPGGICLLVNGEKLITGDTLFVGDCGRTDLPGGSSKALFESLHNKLKPLDDAVEVYPGHDYGKSPSSTIGEEKQTNPAMRCRTYQELDALP
jgi:glyoxylase-like metal-dependent hydrolase (beta-lactamase superfamily II)